MCLCNIMAGGFRFMPMGLVRLRTSRLSAWVSKMQHERRCSRTRGADVSFRYVKMKIPNKGMGMTSCTGSAWRILGDLKKSQLVELRTRLRTRTVGFRCSLTPDEFLRYERRTRSGTDGKARIERIYISLLMSKNL